MNNWMKLGMPGKRGKKKFENGTNKYIKSRPLNLHDMFFGKISEYYTSFVRTMILLC